MVRKNEGKIKSDSSSKMKGRTGGSVKGTRGLWWAEKLVVWWVKYRVLLRKDCLFPRKNPRIPAFPTPSRKLSPSTAKVGVGRPGVLVWRRALRAALRATLGASWPGGWRVFFFLPSPTRANRPVTPVN